MVHLIKRIWGQFKTLLITSPRHTNRLRSLGNTLSTRLTLMLILKDYIAHLTICQWCHIFISLETFWRQWQYWNCSPHFHKQWQLPLRSTDWISRRRIKNLLKRVRKLDVGWLIKWTAFVVHSNKQTSSSGGICRQQLDADGASRGYCIIIRKRNTLINCHVWETRLTGRVTQFNPFLHLD